MPCVTLLMEACLFHSLIACLFFESIKSKGNMASVHHCPFSDDLLKLKLLLWLRVALGSPLITVTRAHTDKCCSSAHAYIH